MILVTGARGFLGSRLVRRLRESGHRAAALDIGPSFDLQQDEWTADLAERGHVDSLISRAPAPDTVIHLAGHIEIAFRKNPLSPLLPPCPGEENIGLLYRGNFMTTVGILEFCLRKKVRKIIFSSSQAVYGMPDGNIVNENSPCRPLEHYGASKLCAERALCTASSPELKVLALRFPGLYSEERESGAVYRFCRSALKDGRITIDIGFPLPFDILHIDDALGAIEKALLYDPKDYECLNIATGEPCSLSILAGQVAGLVPGCRFEYPEISQPPICLDPSRARERLSWTALPREERLRAMLDSLKSKDI
jgi:UDP-glucose 4-epimerase